MYTYRGVSRRQVGGGIWSTIMRGIRPMIMNLITTLKPHAKTAAKRVAQSALNVGSDLAFGALRGKLNKDHIKKSVKSEATNLTNDAFSTLKRKLGTQTGSGNKRRRLNPPRKSKRKSTMKRKYSKPVKKRRGKRCCVKRKKRGVKRNKRSNIRRVKRTAIKKRKRRTVSRKALKDLFNP